MCKVNEICIIPESLGAYEFYRYIYNVHGIRVSEHYHSLEVLDCVIGQALVGKLGAMKYLLQLPSNKNGNFIPSASSFHSIEYSTELGLLLGKTGAMTYVLNRLTCKKLTQGYHRFFWDNYQLYGVIGCREVALDLWRNKMIA